MRHRIRIKVPDSLAGTDLQHHLRNFNPRLAPGGDGRADIVVEAITPPVLVLRALRDWADTWNHVGEIEVSIDRRRFILVGHALHWTRGGIEFPL